MSKAELLLRQQVGATIRTLRHVAGIKAINLAAAVGISQAQISRIEHGKQGIRAGTALRIAAGLGVPIFYLFMTQQERRLYEGEARTTNNKAERGTDATGTTRRAGW